MQLKLMEPEADIVRWILNKWYFSNKTNYINEKGILTLENTDGVLFNFLYRIKTELPIVISGGRLPRKDKIH